MFCGFYHGNQLRITGASFSWRQLRTHAIEYSLFLKKNMKEKNTLVEEGQTKYLSQIQLVAFVWTVRDLYWRQLVE